MAHDITLEAALTETLNEWSEAEQKALFDEISKGAKECKKEVAQLSPKGKGKYRQGWTVRTKKTKHSIEATVYNKAQPGLTWLLENGHVIRNKYGTQQRRNGGGSRTTPNPHISTARDHAAEKIRDELLKVL